MGVVVFSGILVGTLFTLFVEPMFYTFIASPHVHRDEDEVSTAAATHPG